MRTPALITASLLLAALSAAGSPLDPLLADLTANRNKLSAVAVAETKDSDNWDIAVAGFLPPRGDQPADRHTLFRACSLTKPVFAFLVMKLVAERQIDLDRPLYLYLRRPLGEFPEFADLGGDPRHRLITARMVLSHQTGLPNWRWQTKEKKLTFLFEPGTGFAYSGEAHRLLQLAVEQLTGRSLGELCQTYVFGPLNMKDSRLTMDRDAEKRLALDLAVVPPPFLVKMRGEENAAGSLLTSISDYAQFLAAVMSGKGIDPTVRAEMLRPQVLVTSRQLFGPLALEKSAKNDEPGVSWCLGWAHQRTSRGEAWFHVGVEGPSENFVLFFLQRKEGVVILGAGPDPTGITGKIIQQIYGETGIPFGWLRY